jgi:hypothetical protein
MKNAVMNKIDRWAESKTQEEFNEFVVKWIVVPVFAAIAFTIMTIDNWPL